MHTPTRRAPLGVTLLTAMVLSTATIPAQSQMVVNDPIHQIQNILTQLQAMAKDAAEYSVQASRWYQTYRHYQQQLVRVQGIIKSFQMPPGQPVQQVPTDYMVQERCGGTLSLAGILKAITPTSKGDYIAQQRSICQEIQRLENLKFNYSIEFLETTMPMIRRDLGAIEAMRQLDSTNGTVDGSAQASAQLGTELQGQLQQWQAQMSSYDGLISSLQASQRQLAQMALKGDKSPIGSLVRTGALQGALRVGK